MLAEKKKDCAGTNPLTEIFTKLKESATRNVYLWAIDEDTAPAATFVRKDMSVTSALLLMKKKEGPV
jgi:hypothetical protein